MNALRNLVANSPKPAMWVADGSADIIPNLEDVSPAYQQISAAHVELLDSQKALKARGRELQAAIMNGHDQPGVSLAQVEVARLAGNTLEARASDRDMLSAVMARLAATEEAIRLSEIKLRDERIATSRLVCQMLDQQHRDMVLKLFELFTEVHKVWIDYEALLRGLRLKGVSYASLRQQTPDFLGGGPMVRGSELHGWFKDLADAGFIKRSQFPEAYR